MEPIETNKTRATALIDRFGRVQDYLRISVTDRCNLRCTYCMPASGVLWQQKQELLTLEEIARIARIMASLGVKKVRVTGGEPLLRKGIVGLIRELGEIPGLRTVAMTTNGVLLSEHARTLKEAGLSGLNLSLDTLKRDVFQSITLRDEFERVWKSVETAIAAGFAPLKMNVVVMPGVNEGELLDFVELTRTKPINVRFIEYMPFKENRWDKRGFVTYEEMRRRIEERYELRALPETFTENRVAEDFQVDGFVGMVSIIASMTRSFCSSCSRLRLTSTGSLKSCLFFPAEESLRDVMRNGASDQEIADNIRAVVQGKREGHPAPEELERTNDLSMIEIGG
jgi:cyclic pyranopterin phosphate synthase